MDKSEGGAMQAEVDLDDDDVFLPSEPGMPMLCCSATVGYLGEMGEPDILRYTGLFFKA